MEIDDDQLQDVQVGRPVDDLQDQENDWEDLLAVDVDRVQEVAGVLVDVGLLHRTPTVFRENFDLVKQLFQFLRAKVLASPENVSKFVAAAVVVVVDVDVVGWNIFKIFLVVGAVFDLGERRPAF